MSRTSYWICVGVLWAGLFLTGLNIGDVLAQSSLPETGPSVPNFWGEMWEMAKAGGAFTTGAMAVIVWKLDKERIKYRDDYNALVERMLPLFQQSTELQQQVKDVLTGPKRRT